MQTSARLFGVIMLVLGVAILARTFAAGGGALALGTVLGVLFLAAGGGRLYVESRRD